MTISDFPEPQPSSKLRRSLRLEEQLTEAHQSQAQVLLTGAGVNDFFITRADESRRLTAFLHGYCVDEKIGYVRYSMSDGASSYRTLPGDEAVSVRGADADDHPAQVVRQVLCGDAGLYQAAVAIACHPLRRLLTGTPDGNPGALSMRPHPMTAILALHALAGWTPRPARQARTRVRRLLAADAGLRPLGEESRHASSHPYVPILLPPDGCPPGPPPGVRWTHSGAQVLPCVPPGDQEAAASLLGRVRLAAAADHASGA
jgi:hypothetical protein